MTQNQISEILIRFEADTLTSVSPSTAHKLVQIMDSDSLEDLIQLLLRNLAAETELIPTSSQVAYPLQAKFLPKVKGDYALNEMMSQVTPENMHEHVDFGKPVGKELLK